MDMLVLITALATIQWYIIDRVKPIWENVKHGKYITIALAAVFGFALSFGYNLDIIYGFNLVDNPTVIGKVITALAMMSGSSAISEIIGKIKTK